MAGRKPLARGRTEAAQAAARSGKGKKRVLVLGVSGMLGSMVFEYLRGCEAFTVAGTVRSAKETRRSRGLYVLDADKSNWSALSRFKPDYIVNCIGIIKPLCKDDDPAGVERAIRINALFPHLLARAAGECGARVIQIATDCVFSGVKGLYRESDPHDALDVYGKTKSLGEVRVGHFLNIRCSIIGPEKEHKRSLLEWFLGNPRGSTLKGFAHHTWNGVTTLQFAQLVEDIAQEGKAHFDALVAASHVHHFVPNTTVNKYELLSIFNEAFDAGMRIERVDHIGSPVHRTLATAFDLLPHRGRTMPMKDAVGALAEYQKRCTERG